MKNNYLIFTMLILILIICVGIFAPNDKVLAFADDEKQYVCVFGHGEVESKPDCCEINFGLKIRGNTFKEGQEKLTETYDNFSSQIKEVDEEAEIFVCYSSCYPSFEKEIQGYDFHSNICVKTCNLDEVEKILNIAGENSISSLNGIDYKLEDKQSLYNEALKNAKADAEQKAKAINENANLQDLFEVSVTSFSRGDKDASIKVEACVKARFLVNALEAKEEKVIKEEKIENKEILQEEKVEDKEVMPKQEEKESIKEEVKEEKIKEVA